MKSKLFFITTLLLIVGLAAALYFLFDFSNQNKRMVESNQQLTQQLKDTEGQLDASENELESLGAENTQLTTETNNLTVTLEELQSDYEALYGFTYCGNDLIDLEMDYRSNLKASEALTLWVDQMWGDVLGSSWMDFWSSDEPGFHVVETGYANDYFVVYFDDQNFYDAPNGVFIVSHHCWLDVEPVLHGTQ